MIVIWGLPALASENLVGQPTPGAIGMQPGVTPLKHDATFFHDAILLPIITAIVLFVLGLLVWVMIRYNKRANPTPAKWSHNTVIEVAWTIVPILILTVISVFSFRLLYAYHDMPKPYMTVKATGYQWYWGYEYPDNGITEFVSNVLPEDKAIAQKVPYLLAATEPLVVPVDKPVRVLVTGADVIHAFAVPAFGVIADAVPGRINETWFTIEKPGIYYGNCRELCGVQHAYMPIEVRAVSQADFDAWTASKGGYKVGGAAAPAPAAAVVAAATPAVIPATAPAAAPASSATPAPAVAPASN
jgi:cytochrome c oxidase subunit 2